MCTRIKLIKSRFFLFCAILSSFLFLSCPFGIKTELNTPRNIKVSDITSNSAIVFWDSVKNAKSYEVMWTIKSNDSWNFDTTKNVFVKLENLLFDEEYTVKVCANPAEGSMGYWSSDYGEVTFRTSIDEIPAGEFSRPQNITASLNNEKTAITVGWNAVQGASYYDLNFEFVESYSPVKYRIVKTVPAGQTEFTYTGTMYGNGVNIKVAARNSDFSDSCRWSKEIYLAFN